MADNSQALTHRQAADGRADRQDHDGPTRDTPGQADRLDRWWLVMLVALLLSIALAVPAVADAARGEQLDAAARSTLMRALDAADSGEWPAARRHVDALGSPLLSTYIVWRELVDGSSTDDFERYATFLRRYPDWPRLGAVRANAELRIDETVGYADRLRFFVDRRPVTRQGRIRLAEAELALGETEHGRELVRQSWRDDNYSTSEERYFLEQFGHLLTAEDHTQRLDRLLWDGRANEAERLFGKVGADRVALARARLGLQAMAPGIDGLVRRVPQALANDPGLAYDRLRWRQKKGLDEGVQELLLAPPTTLGRPSLWWNERIYAIRTALSDGDFDLAYALARDHGQSTGASFAEAAWLTGWLALRHEGDARTALGHFAQMYDAVSMPISRARAAYWSGRAAAAMGDLAATGRWYRLAADHPTTYYGQLALDELGEPLTLAEATLRLDTVPAADPAFDRHDQVRLVRLFCALETAEHAVPFLERLLLDIPDKGRVMALARDCGRPDIVVTLAKRGVAAGVVDPIATFPVPAHHGLLYPVGNVVEPALSLAIARQESHFDVTAESPAGALGLMQVMPATGRAVAERFGLGWSERLLHRDSHYNAQIGAYYLGMMAERFDGTLEMMAAAYNAGPPRVTAWVAQNGDPRELDTYARIDWVELIPFRETRNYVQRVIEGRNVYRELLSTASVLPVSVVLDSGPLVPPPLPVAKPRVY